LRGELLFFGNTPEPVAPLGKGGGRLDRQRWNLPNIGGGVLRDKLMSAVENQRSSLEAVMSNVGAKRVVALDWCYETGKLLGGGLVANLVNEASVQMASRRTKSEKIEELIPMFEAVKSRPGMEAVVCIIDKVPPSLDEHAISKLETTIMTHLGVKYVRQDRFHVAHCVSKWFNNCDPRYHYYVIILWREATVVRRAQQEKLVDEMLRRGEITKTRKGVSVARGTPLSVVDIQQLKDSGAYHNLFSTKDVLVPEDVMDAETLRRTTQRWKERILEVAFHPPDSNGVRQPILMDGKRLIASVELLDKVRQKSELCADLAPPPRDTPSPQRLLCCHERQYPPVSVLGNPPIARISPWSSRVPVCASRPVLCVPRAVAPSGAHQCSQAHPQVHRAV
jgi:hypothetical protein